MDHMDWAVGILLLGIAILFFFPLLLGLQLKNNSNKKSIEK